MTTLQMLDEAHQQLEAISVLGGRDLATFWASLDWERATYSRDALLDFYPALLDEYGVLTSSVFTDLYQDIREEASPSSTFTPEIITSIDGEKVAANLRYSLSPIFGGAGPEQALKNVQSRFYDHNSFLAKNTLWENAYRDPEEVQFLRSAEAGACTYCIGLCARTDYVSESSADFKSHDLCRCKSYVAFSESQIVGPSPEDYLQDYYQRLEAEEERKHNRE